MSARVSTKKTVTNTNSTGDPVSPGWALVQVPDQKKHYWRKNQHACACGRRTRSDLGPHGTATFDDTIPVYPDKKEGLCIPCMHERQRDKRITLQVQQVCEPPEIAPYKP